MRYIPLLVLYLLLTLNGLSKATTEDRSFESLTTIPTAPSGTSKFILKGNELTSVASSAFASYPSLNHLDLQQNLLTSIDNNAFCGTVIDKLYLSYNPLTVFPNLDCLQHTLEDIYISQTDITSLGPGCMSALYKLKFLKSRNSLITTIAPDAFCGTVVFKLDFFGNDMTTVPDVSCLGATLTYYNLYNNKLTSVSSESIDDLVILDFFNVGANQLRDASFVAAVSPTVTELRMKSNQITHMNSLNHLVNLERLLLHGNDLTCIQIVSCTLSWAGHF